MITNAFNAMTLVPEEMRALLTCVEIIKHLNEEDPNSHYHILLLVRGHHTEAGSSVNVRAPFMSFNKWERLTRGKRQVDT